MHVKLRPDRDAAHAFSATRVVVLAFLFTATTLSGCSIASATRYASKRYPDYVISTRSISGLGRVLVDGHGYTLYAYLPDHRGRPRCTGYCAKQWPPLVLPNGVSHPAAGAGLNRSLLGTVRRANGTLQVTFNGWPLYLYVDDSAPGQATGQGDDMGLWLTLSADGSLDRNEVSSD